MINHLFNEYKSLLSLLQATVLPWLLQNSHNENSNLNPISSTACNSMHFETPIKNLPQISKSNGWVPPNRSIISSKFRNNNGEVAPNKLIKDKQFKNNLQECFSKKQINVNLANQLADICNRKHQTICLLIKKSELILALSQKLFT